MGTTAPNRKTARVSVTNATAALALLALSTAFFPVEHTPVLRSAWFLGFSIHAGGGSFILLQFSPTARKVWLAILFVFLFALPVNWLVRGLIGHDTMQAVFGSVMLAFALIFTAVIVRENRRTKNGN